MEEEPTDLLACCHDMVRYINDMKRILIDKGTNNDEVEEGMQADLTKTYDRITYPSLLR
ncbi:hypothetical protein HPP92_026609 [Vanilla planifolia]|uniref:Uncharacterized protein n=1 Tax=Vanilla planifolia TaxID=51239 RepID=A0A835U5T8_VANPL|nr:hypothetical protein HPP92_026609 [Vanilla planifolia]